MRRIPSSTALFSSFLFLGLSLEAQSAPAPDEVESAKSKLAAMKSKAAGAGPVEAPCQSTKSSKVIASTDTCPITSQSITSNRVEPNTEVAECTLKRAGGR
jgi:hypothetical protein